MAGDFDDAPRWYWAVADGRSNGSTAGQAGNLFVVANGQQALWSRVRSEIDVTEKCSWNSFGARNGDTTLADCMYVFLQAREMYGVDYNRLVLEFAQVPAFAHFIHDGPSDLCNRVSNPISTDLLRREAYSETTMRALGDRVGETLGLEMEWWQ